MRQGHGSKRSRGRNSNRRNVSSRNQTFDSNGPSVRIRGNAVQVHEKYLAMARDANASGDRVSAENFYQHAEHYFRIIATQREEAEARNNNAQGRNNGSGRGNRNDGDNRRPPEALEGAEQPAIAEPAPAEKTTEPEAEVKSETGQADPPTQAVGD